MADQQFCYETDIHPFVACVCIKILKSLIKWPVSGCLSKGSHSCVRPGDKGGHGGGGGGGEEQQEGQHGHHYTPQLGHHDISR